VYRWVNGRDPRQYGLGFGPWTRHVAADLIERKPAIRLGATAGGELLAKLGATPQKPLQRAYRRDPEAIEKWQREIFPGIARNAKADGGEEARAAGSTPSATPRETWRRSGEVRFSFGTSPDFAPMRCTARPSM